MLPVNANALAAALNASTVGAPATSAKSKPVESADEAKLKKAGGDFESILLSSMWKSMKQSFGDSGEGDSDAASGTINDWGIEVMSGAVGKAGGLGIAKLILKHLEPDLPDPSTTKTVKDTNVLDNLADRRL